MSAITATAAWIVIIYVGLTSGLLLGYARWDRAASAGSRWAPRR